MTVSQNSTSAFNRQLVLDAAEGLAVAHTVRGVCPACQGGQSRERSLYITRNPGEIVWICHRGSCYFRGRGRPLGEGSGAISANRPSPSVLEAFVPKPFEGNLADWDTIDALRAFDGSLLGHQTRKRHPDGSKTVRLWMTSPGKPYSAYMSTDDASLWLVEDIASAKALRAVGAHAVALLGTSVNEAWMERELGPAIRYYGLERLFVALDAGAEEAAGRCKKALVEDTGLDTVVVPLRDDIKDMAPEEVRSLIDYYDPPHRSAP